MLPKAWENNHATDKAHKNPSPTPNFMENLFHTPSSGESWTHLAEGTQLMFITVTLFMWNEKWHTSTERKIKPQE